MAKRSQLLVFHRRMALIFAPLLFLQALTGSALLFRAELDRLTVPEPMQMTNTYQDVSLSDMAAAAATAEPGYRVTRIFLPSTTRDTAFVQLISADGATKRFAAIDPGNGHVLAAGSIWRFPLEAALQWHDSLLDGRFGMAMVLFNAAALIFMSTTGMLYWWPGSQRIAKALAVRPTAPPRARLRQWHRSIGVILTPVLLFSATTGILLIFSDLTASAAAQTIAPPTPSAAQIDKAFARAKSAYPGAVAGDIRFPAADRIVVSFHTPQHSSLATDTASVQLSDAALLERLPTEDNPALWIKVLPLHSGKVMGLAGHVFLSIEGLALMILAATGPLMWWQARRPKRKKS